MSLLLGRSVGVNLRKNNIKKISSKKKFKLKKKSNGKGKKRAENIFLPHGQNRPLLRNCHVLEVIQVRQSPRDLRALTLAAALGSWRTKTA